MFPNATYVKHFLSLVERIPPHVKLIVQVSKVSVTHYFCDVDWNNFLRVVRVKIE